MDSKRGTTKGYLITMGRAAAACALVLVAAGCMSWQDKRDISTSHFESMPTAKIEGTKLTLDMPPSDIPADYGVEPKIKRDKGDILVRAFFATRVKGPKVWEFDLGKYGFAAESAKGAQVYWMEPDGKRVKLTVEEGPMHAAVVEKAGSVRPLSRAKVRAIFERAGGNLPGAEDLAYLSGALVLKGGGGDASEMLQLDNLRTVADRILSTGNGPGFKWLATLEAWQGATGAYVIQWEADFATAHPEAFFADDVYGPYLEDVAKNMDAAFASGDDVKEQIRAVEAFAAAASGAPKERAGKWAAALGAPK